MERMHKKFVGVLCDAQNRPYNPRGLPGDTTTLQKLIRTQGQRTPIRVTQPNEAGVHIVTRGHRRKAAIDALRADARSHMNQEKEGTDTYQYWADQVLEWSYYLVEVSAINPTDLDAILADADAGIIQEPVNPVALGDTITYRMDNLGWTFRRCIESLGLEDWQGKACIRAADPNLTVPSVQSALRSGELSLSMFMKKFSRMDRMMQDKVMEEAERRAEENPRAHGVMNGRIINAALHAVSEDGEIPVAPDAEVLPLLAQARADIEKAFRLRSRWSRPVEDAALFHVEEILKLIEQETREDADERSDGNVRTP